MMKSILISLVILMIGLFFPTLISCSSDDEESDKVTDKPVYSLTPSSGVADDTITLSITTTTDIDFPDIRVQGSSTTLLDELTTENTLSFLIPYIPKGSGLQNLTVQLNFEAQVDTVINAFEYLTTTVDSINTNVVYEDGDTLYIYGKNFSRAVDNYRLFDPLEDTDTKFVWSIHDVIGAKRNRLTAVMYRSFSFTADYEIILGYSGTGFPSIPTEEDMEVFRLGHFERGDLFKVLSTEATPEQRIEVLNNNDFDHLFINGSKMSLVWFDREENEGFSRKSIYQVPANVIKGSYQIIGFSEDEGPMKNLSNAPINIVDITYCPESRTVKKGDSLRVDISPNSLLTSFCSNCPAEIALVDEISNTSFPVQFAGAKSVQETDGQTFLTFAAPVEPPSNAVYALSFKTQNGYSYVPEPGCPNVAIQLID